MVGEQDKFSDWNQTCLITLFTFNILLSCSTFHSSQWLKHHLSWFKIHIRELAYLAMFLLILSGKWQTKSSNWYHSWRFYSLDRLLEEQRWVMLSDGTQTLCEESCDPLRILEYVQSKAEEHGNKTIPRLSLALREPSKPCAFPCWWTAQLSPSHHQHNLLDVVACTLPCGEIWEPLVALLWLILSLLVHLMKYFHASITCFTGPPPSLFKYSICARFRDVVQCTFPSSCARFPAVVHVSQKLCTFSQSPPNNVRVQLYTHWAHSNQQKALGATKHVLPLSCIAGDTSGEWPQKCLNNNSGPLTACFSLDNDRTWRS